MKENYHFLLQKEFYKGNLVAIHSKDSSDFSLLGQNNKGLIVLIEEGETEENINFLAKILQAIQHDIETDVGRIMLPKEEEIHLQSLKNKTTAKTIISFGLPPEKLGLSMSLGLYEAADMSGIRLLFADKLAIIQSQREKKSALWTCLQKMFLS